MNILFIQLHLWSTEYWSEIFFNRLFSFLKNQNFGSEWRFLFFPLKKTEIWNKKTKKTSPKPGICFWKIKNCFSVRTFSESGRFPIFRSTNTVRTAVTVSTVFHVVDGISCRYTVSTFNTPLSSRVTRPWVTWCYRHISHNVSSHDLSHIITGWWRPDRLEKLNP